MIGINREQRRNLAAIAKAKGWSKKQTERAIIEFKRKAYKNQIHKGDKVQLNQDTIVNDINWERKTEAYRLWCHRHFGKEFTAKAHDDGRQDLWQLEEDETNPRWLFHSGDLIVKKKPPA